MNIIKDKDILLLMEQLISEHGDISPLLLQLICKVSYRLGEGNGED